MAWLIELYNPNTATTEDITSRVLAIETNETLDSDVTAFSLTCKNIYLIHLFNRVTIKRGGVTFLTGIILMQEEDDGGILNYKRTTFDCEDWGHLLSKRIVAKTYLASSPDTIIKNMLTEHLPEFTRINIKASTTIIDRMQFDYVSVKEAIENIFDLLDIDWHWYVDKNKDFHFFYRYEAAGTTFTKNNISTNTLMIDYSGQEHINKVWIVGRKQASPTAIDQYFTGDGNQKYFTLSYEPNETDIYLGGVLQDSSLEANDNGSKDFLINASEKVFYTPTYAAACTGAIRVNYKPTKQFIDYYENNADKAKYGLMEKSVKNQDVVNKLEARRYGKEEVKKTSTIKRKLSFRSRVTTVALGQLCPVSIIGTYWNITGNFLIKSIKRNITAADEEIQFELEEVI